MVNIILVERKLVLLENLKRELAKLPKKDLALFRKDMMLQKAVEKFLEEMVQICIDIAKHIIADNKMKLPDDNKGLFDVLCENGVILNDTAKLMKKMVGFRNILVHMYEKIDIESVYINYRKNLGDFDKYAGEISKYIEK